MKPHIAITGPSAVGKSVVCRSICSLFDAEYISSSSILLDIAIRRKILRPNVLRHRAFWLSQEAKHFNQARLSDTSIDREADTKLLKLINPGVSRVVDSLSYPFLHEESTNLVKIYLTASLKERVNRASLRQTSYDKSFFEKGLANKDEITAKIFMKLWGINLYTKKYRSNFDITLNNTEYTLPPIVPGQEIILSATLLDLLQLVSEHFQSSNTGLIDNLFSPKLPKQDRKLLTS